MIAAPNPFAPRRMSNFPFAVIARRREFPVASCPPAETVAVVVSVGGGAAFGASATGLGAATSAAWSAGGAPLSANAAAGTTTPRATSGRISTAVFALIGDGAYTRSPRPRRDIDPRQWEGNRADVRTLRLLHERSASPQWPAQWSAQWSEGRRRRNSRQWSCGALNRIHDTMNATAPSVAASTVGVDS